MQRVWLPDHEPRCRPSRCRDREACGRYLASPPATGATIMDGSVEREEGADEAGTRCRYWIAPSRCVPPARGGPTVHEAWS